MANDFSNWGSAEGLIKMGYESMEGWKQWFDEKCTAAVCEAAEQFAGMLGSLFGAATSGANNMLAKVDTMSLKPSSTPAPSVGELKKQPPQPDLPSPSPELVQLASKSLPMKFNCVDMDKEGCSYNFAPSSTPSLVYGQSAGMSV
jgi:hypothetical protein